MSEEAVKIIRRQDDSLVDAKLLGGLQPQDLVLVERDWTVKRQEMMQGLLAREVPRQLWPQSLHWDWGQKANDLKYLSSHGWGIECEGAWQGVLAYQTWWHWSVTPTRSSVQGLFSSWPNS